MLADESFSRLSTYVEPTVPRTHYMRRMCLLSDFCRCCEADDHISGFGELPFSVFLRLAHAYVLLSQVSWHLAVWLALSQRASTHRDGHPICNREERVPTAVAGARLVWLFFALC